MILSSFLPLFKNIFQFYYLLVEIKFQKEYNKLVNKDQTKRM